AFSSRSALQSSFSSRGSISRRRGSDWPAALASGFAGRNPLPVALPFQVDQRYAPPPPSTRTNAAAIATAASHLERVAAACAPDGGVDTPASDSGVAWRRAVRRAAARGWVITSGSSAAAVRELRESSSGARSRR